MSEFQEAIECFVQEVQQWTYDRELAEDFILEILDRYATPEYIADDDEMQRRIIDAYKQAHYQELLKQAVINVFGEDGLSSLEDEIDDLAYEAIEGR